MANKSNVKLDEYYFIRVSHEECVKAKNDQEALKMAIEAGIVDSDDLENYVVVSKDIDGVTIAGTIKIGISWQD